VAVAGVDFNHLPVKHPLCHCCHRQQWGQKAAIQKIGHIVRISRCSMDFCFYCDAAPSLSSCNQGSRSQGTEAQHLKSEILLNKPDSFRRKPNTNVTHPRQSHLPTYSVDFAVIHYVVG